MHKIACTTQFFISLHLCVSHGLCILLRMCGCVRNVSRLDSEHNIRFATVGCLFALKSSTILFTIQDAILYIYDERSLCCVLCRWRALCHHGTHPSSFCMIAMTFFSNAIHLRFMSTLKVYVSCVCALERERRQERETEKHFLTGWSGQSHRTIFVCSLATHRKENNQ